MVSHDKVAGQTPADVFHRQIAFEGPLDAEQIARLFEIADKCPVHRTLESGSQVETTPLAADPPSPAAAKAEADEHFRDMDQTCNEAG